MSADLTGRTIAHFHVAGKLGAGGMGEVWRAHDPQLGRDVALKVLPEAFTQDTERLARFEREAKLLAQLNHQNIAHIYGLETSGATRALVMELVEGPTLADRLKTGALPVEESLAIARQIAEALEEAHEKGIIHRDLKPANIKASPDGKVKVLDFGLAKAMEPVTAAPASASQLAQSPTLTLGATVQGVILGTAAYMAPEQAKGLTVDKRADIWAFGVVLWEMLTGRSLFAGESVPDTLAFVLQREIDFEALPKSTPPAIRRLLRRCLERRPKSRLHDIADARLVIEEVLSGKAGEEPVPAAPGVPRWLAWMLAAALVLSLAGLVSIALRGARAVESFRGQFEIALPPGKHLDGYFRRAVAISPDGRKLALIVSGAELPPADPLSRDRHIEIRAIDDAVFRPVAGTEGAIELAFSPDGKWLAFTSIPDGIEDRTLAKPYSELRKVPVEGGQAVTLCANRGGWGLSWGSSGWIAFAGHDGPIFRVRQEGGAPEAVTRIEGSGRVLRHGNPLLLPDGRTILYDADDVSYRKSGPHKLYAQRLGAEAGVLLAEGATDPRFVPPDRVLFARDGEIFSLRFDPETMRPEGDPIPFAKGVAHSTAMRTDVWETSQAQYDASTSGLMVVAPGSIYPAAPKEIVRVDSTGRQTILDLPVEQYISVQVSPDGGRLLAFSNYPGVQPLVYDLERSASWRLRLSLSRFAQYFAVWGPRAGQITLISMDEDGTLELVARRLDESTDAFETIARLERSQIAIPAAWAPDGKSLVAVSNPFDGNFGLLLCREGRCEPYIDTPFPEVHPAISHDGRWLTYASVESGRGEVWLRPFGREGDKLLVSIGGGLAPTWSADDRSIFYRSVDPDASKDPDFPIWSFYRVSFSADGDQAQVGRPERLFSGEFGVSWPTRSYDVDAQGSFYLTRERKLDAAERLRRAELLFPTKLRVLVGILDSAGQTAPK